jgi:hypothetical protein
MLSFVKYRIQMKISFHIPLVLGVLMMGAPAETSGDALPATGFKIDLAPDPSGYKTEINISPDAGFTDVTVKPNNSVLQEVLDQHVDRDQQNRVKLLNVIIRTGALPRGDYPLTIVATGKDQVIERDVWLTVPTETIEMPDTLVIIREQNWIGSADTIANQPQIWEMGRRVGDRNNRDAKRKHGCG